MGIFVMKAFLKSRRCHFEGGLPGGERDAVGRASQPPDRAARGASSVQMLNQSGWTIV